MTKFEEYIGEAEALQMLMKKGDYSESQAKIILGHSMRKTIAGVTCYPKGYIQKRAKR